MKLGRYIPLGDYKNVKIGYGTIDHKNLKTIYLSFTSWLEPNDDAYNFDTIVRSSRNNIKKLIYNLGMDIFLPESIVDLDVRTNGIKKEKRSFMNLEITLYVGKPINIKDKDLKNDISNLMKVVIDDCLNDDRIFNFNKKKK
jgi:hypothetical protein